jgi:hypothetical protein
LSANSRQAWKVSSSRKPYSDRIVSVESPLNLYLQDA